jgi:DNA-binding CsgD family transcriptional regulator
MDPEGRLLSANKQAQKLLGVSKAALEKKACYELIEGRDTAGNLYCTAGCPLMVMAARNEPIQSFDLQIKRKDKKKAWVNVSTLIEKSDRRSYRIIHRLRPTAGPKRIEDRLTQIQATLEEIRNQSQSDKPLRRADDIKFLAKRFGLTHREAEVLALLTQGLVAKEIGVRLNLSTSTARTHIQNTLAKLGVHSKVEAIRLVLTHP